MKKFVMNSLNVCVLIEFIGLIVNTIYLSARYGNESNLYLIIHHPLNAVIIPLVLILLIFGTILIILKLDKKNNRKG